MNFTMYSNFAGNFKSEGAERACEIAKSLGFTSVEFIELIQDTWVPCIKDVTEAKKTKQILDRHGLPVACYSIGATLYVPGMTPETVTNVEKELYHYAEIAAAVGSPILHHTLIMNNVRADEIPFSEALRLIVPAAIRIAKYAHSLGVRCTYEPQGPFFNGVEGFGSLYRAVKAECPWVGVCGDVGNMLFADVSPVDFFGTFAKEILHVHIKDYAPTEPSPSVPSWAFSAGGKAYKECLLGTGCIDLDTCLSLLKEAGYTGAFAFENGPIALYEAGVRNGQALIGKYFS